MKSIDKEFNIATPKQLEEQGWKCPISDTNNKVIYFRGYERLLFEKIDNEKLKFISYLKIRSGK